MIDLNKERETFEALPQIKGILIAGEFFFSTLSMNYKPNNSQNESHLQCTYFLNGAWYAWQEKAKAQAVPEDWVIVPQELPLDMALKIAKERIIEQPPVKDPVLNEILEKALKENLQYEQCRLIRDYKEMVKRLGESGAEG
ncbi:hypothetical protein ACOUXA_05735 [Acinetobacter baumannii]